jgi:hypothetical protein
MHGNTTTAAQTKLLTNTLAIPSERIRSLIKCTPTALAHQVEAVVEATCHALARPYVPDNNLNSVTVSRLMSRRRLLVRSSLVGGDWNNDHFCAAHGCNTPNGFSLSESCLSLPWLRLTVSSQE